MSDLLDTFLEEHAAQPWAWGAVDCSLVLADWMIANGHADPAAHLRGTYSTEAGCREIVTSNGGLFPLVAGICEGAGLAAARLPARGVIGVIGVPHNMQRQWGAIHDGTRWLIRGIGGFGSVTARVLGMWRV